MCISIIISITMPACCYFLEPIKVNDLYFPQKFIYSVFLFTHKNHIYFESYNFTYSYQNYIYNKVPGCREQVRKKKRHIGRNKEQISNISHCTQDYLLFIKFYILLSIFSFFFHIKESISIVKCILNVCILIGLFIFLHK